MIKIQKKMKKIIAFQKIVCFQLLQWHVPDMLNVPLISVVYINNIPYKK